MSYNDTLKVDALRLIEVHLRDISKSLQVISGRTKEEISDKPPKTGYAASYFAKSDKE